MNNEDLKRFFESERKSPVPVPDEFFRARVVARIRSAQSSRSAWLWELAPASSRVVLALGAVLILALAWIQTIPLSVPEVAAVDLTLEEDQGSADQWIFSEQELPAGSELLDELVTVEFER